MNDQDWLNLALASMHSGQWFGFKKDYTGNERMSYENIIILDDTKSKPTEAEVNAKIQELKDAETANQNARTTSKAKLKTGEALTDAEIKALFGDN